MAREILRIRTLVQIIILVLSFFGRFIESLAEPVSIGSPDDPIIQQKEWLLEELNGVHLRL